MLCEFDLQETSFYFQLIIRRILVWDLHSRDPYYESNEQTEVCSSFGSLMFLFSTLWKYYRNLLFPTFYQTIMISAFCLWELLSVGLAMELSSLKCLGLRFLFLLMNQDHQSHSEWVAEQSSTDPNLLGIRSFIVIFLNVKTVTFLLLHFSLKHSAWLHGLIGRIIIHTNLL